MPRLRGENRRLPVQLADRFPHRFSSSELGLIPENWTIGPFSKIVDHLRETEHPKGFAAHAVHPLQHSSLRFWKGPLGTMGEFNQESQDNREAWSRLSLKTKSRDRTGVATACLKG